MALADKQPFSVTWLPVMTLTGWLSFLAVGLLGFSLPYGRPQVPPAESDLPPVELLYVELTGESFPMSLPSLVPPSVNTPPPLAERIASPSPLTQVVISEIVDIVAFPVQVKAPVSIVPEDSVGPEAVVGDDPIVFDASLPPAVQVLRYGYGAGRQPAPNYPRQAVKLEQEGAVSVVFTVGADGRVVSTVLSRACPWPLLNNEALRVIKSKWRFPRGEVRRYEVTIRFELTR